MRTVRVLQRRMTTAEAMPAVAAGDLVQVRQVFGTQVGVVLDTLGLYDLVGIRVDGSKFRFKQRDVDLHCSGWADTASLVGKGAIAETNHDLVKRIQDFETKSRNLATECKSRMARVYSVLHVKKTVCLSKIAKLLFATENPTLEQIFGAKIALQTGLYFKLMVPVVDRIDIFYEPRRSDEIRFLSDLYANKNRDQVDAFIEKCKSLISDHRNGFF